MVSQKMQVWLLGWVEGTGEQKDCRSLVEGQSCLFRKGMLKFEIECLQILLNSLLHFIDVVVQLARVGLEVDGG